MTQSDVDEGAMPAPIVLDPNQPAGRPYRGGAGIARFRGIPIEDAGGPEDFVGSATEVWAGHGVGLTVLADGRALRDALRTDPVAYLGPAHAARHGADPLLLVKLLDTGERLFAHFHPDDRFAGVHFDSPHGKTEAWVVVDVAPDVDAYALLGFSRDIDQGELRDWFERQSSDEIVAAMNRVPLRIGDTLLVPARVPHAIGPGVTLVELQQPTDLSILIEYDGYGDLTRDSALLGLDPTTAFEGAELGAFDVQHLRGRPATGSGAFPLFPAEADPYFRAWWVGPDAPQTLLPGFAVLVVVHGEGTLSWATGALDLRRGMTVLVPHGTGEVEIAGQAGVIVCAPPTRDAL